MSDNRHKKKLENSAIFITVFFNSCRSNPVFFNTSK